MLRILKICSGCGHHISTDNIIDGCDRCCSPHVLKIEFLIECLTNSDNIELNRRHISKKCPFYKELMKVLEK